MMCKQVEYTFYPGSVKGLETFTAIRAINFTQAKNKIVKYIYLNKIEKFVVRE